MKNTVKTTINKSRKYLCSLILHKSKCLDLYTRIRKARVTVLLYHRVILRHNKCRITSSPHMLVYQDSFEKQMQLLSTQYHVISLDTYLAAKKNKFLLPRKTVIITFDDGWEDNYLYAFPILKKYHFPATIFISTQYIDKTSAFWQEKLRFLTHELYRRYPLLDIGSNTWTSGIQLALQHLFINIRSDKAWSQYIKFLKYYDRNKRSDFINQLEQLLQYPEYPQRDNSFLDWKQLQEMTQNRISIGSHSISHEVLTELTDAKVLKEIEKSRETIKEKLGISVDHFAYPSGNYNPHIAQLLKDVGYKSASTTIPRLNTQKTDLFQIRRLNVHEEANTNLRKKYSDAMFACRLNGLL